MRTCRSQLGFHFGGEAAIASRLLQQREECFTSTADLRQAEVAEDRVDLATV